MSEISCTVMLTQRHHRLLLVCNTKSMQLLIVPDEKAHMHLTKDGKNHFQYIPGARNCPLQYKKATILQSILQ